MINYLIIAVTMAMVIWLTQRFKLINHCKLAMRVTTQAKGILFDKSLDDLEKERQTQQLAKKLVTQFSLIICSGAGAMLIPLLPLFSLSRIDFVNIPQLLHTIMSVECLLLFTVLGSLSLVKIKRG